MLSANLKRRAFNCVLVLVYLGIPVFGIFLLSPALLERRLHINDLAIAQRNLVMWYQKRNLATKSRINAATEYNKGVASEYVRVGNYFRQRGNALRRKLLKSYTGDPVMVKLQYVQFKQMLEVRARFSYADQIIKKNALLSPYDWEKPGSKPPRTVFDALERQVCIADSLVTVLTKGLPCSIGHIQIGEKALVPEAPPEAEEPEAPLRYVVWPVTVEYVVPFAQLGRSLRCIVTAPANHPCMTVRGVEFTTSGLNQVHVILDVGVLDFG